MRKNIHRVLFKDTNDRIVVFDLSYVLKKVLEWLFKSVKEKSCKEVVEKYPEIVQRVLMRKKMYTEFYLRIPRIGL